MPAPLVMAVKVPSLLKVKEANKPVLLVVAVKASALLDESAAPSTLKEAVGAAVEEVVVTVPLEKVATVPLVVAVMVPALMEMVELPAPLVVACDALALLEDAAAPALLKEAGVTAVEECHSSVAAASKLVRRYW